MPPAPRPNANDRCRTGAGMAGAPKLTPEQQAMFLQHMMMNNHQQFQQRNMQANTFAATNRPSGRQIRDRYANLLSEKEIDEAIEAQEDSGKTFRRVLLVIVLAVIAFLAWVKWDVEEGSMFLAPELLMIAERDAEIRGDATSATTADGKKVRVIQDENAAQLEEYYKILDVNARIREATDDDEVKVAADDTTAEGAEAVRKARLAADRKRRLEIKHVKDALKASFDKRQEEYGQLVSCGRTCEAEHKQVQVAYEALTSKVDREFYGLLFGVNVAKSGRVAFTSEEVSANAEAKIAEVMADKTIDEEVRSMEIAEIKEARDILLDPAARTFYSMYGRKPPEAMKHMSARYGGWGQDLLLRTHKNRLILAWLDYLSDAWADYWVLIIIGFVGFLLPALVQLPRILELAKEIEERQFQMEEMEKRVAAGGRATADPPAAAQ